VTGGRVISSRQIPAGGRHGFFVDVDPGDHTTRLLFLQSGRRPDPEHPTLFHGLAVEAEVLRALEPVGIPVPRVWGVDPERNVLLVERVAGDVWFHPPAEPAEQVAVARDFVRHLARWHRTPPSGLHLPSLGPVSDLPTHQAAQLDGIAGLAAAAGRATGGRLDPLVTFAMEWLRQHIPAVDAPVVLVQGDTGPGNFLYAEGRVTGIVDWELAHLGDPMDDIAWLSWRATQHGFPDFAARLREYEELSDIPVCDERVRYYRLNAFGRLGPFFGLAEMGTSTRPPAIDGLESGRAIDGTWMVMSMLHRRMRLEATSGALGLPIPGRDVEEAAVPSHAGLYDRVLEQLQEMVGRIPDARTAGMGKAIARQVKYLKQLDRNGTVFAGQELDDIGEILGRPQADLPTAREALVAAVASDAVTIDDYLDYHWRRLRRDDHLMRAASGALYERSWPELR
jgi:aminoglycoside phosphotransferase (APT) family kinase protein